MSAISNGNFVTFGNPMVIDFHSQAIRTASGFLQPVSHHQVCWDHSVADFKVRRLCQRLYLPCRDSKGPLHTHTVTQSHSHTHTDTHTHTHTHTHNTHTHTHSHTHMYACMCDCMSENQQAYRVLSNYSFFCGGRKSFWWKASSPPAQTQISCLVFQ